MQATVPVSTVLAMAGSLLLSMGVPVLLLVLWRKKTGAPLLAALWGAIIFPVFVFGLENALHQLCIFGSTGASAFIKGHPWAYILYAGLAAGVFEETGRFVAFRWLLRRKNARQVGVMYGIGHGGIESILIVGIAMISNLIFVLTLNGMGADALLAQTPAAQQASVQTTIDALTGTPPVMFIVSGLERISAIALHISLSVLVFFAVKRPGKLWLYPAAIGLHALVDCFAVHYSLGFVESIFVIEAFVLVVTAAIAVWAAVLYRNDRDASSDSVEIKNEEEPAS